MTSLRQRKSELSVGEEASPNDMKSFFIPRRRRSRALLRVFLVCAGLLIVLLLWNEYSPFRTQHGTTFIDKVSLYLGMQSLCYAVVIDAGSTGTRILGFRFHMNKIDGSLRLESSLWAEVKPGLSSYANNPDQLLPGLRSLLVQAQGFVPEDVRPQTPLLLKATAGLRLLSQEKADKILQVVRSELEKSGFHLEGDAVSIMEGTDEGIFSWFTTNYLLDSFSRPLHESAVVIDLGGGSTQVTFIPSVFKGIPLHFLHPFKDQHKIYTHSYLNLGLMAARDRLLSMVTKGKDKDVETPCFNPTVGEEWSYNGKTYRIRGLAQGHVREEREGNKVIGVTPVADFATCLTQASDLVKSHVHQPDEIDLRTVHAISYFYDRALDVGLISGPEGGIVTVAQFFDEAKKACDMPNSDQPFLCMDLTFIAALLHYGYGLDLTSKVSLSKQLHGHEISWALGAAYNQLNKV